MFETMKIVLLSIAGIVIFIAGVGVGRLPTAKPIAPAYATKEQIDAMVKLDTELVDIMAKTEKAQAGDEAALQEMAALIDADEHRLDQLEKSWRNSFL